MKAAILVESLTGNTWKVGELVGERLVEVGWDVLGLAPLKEPDLQAIQDADIVLIGTWTHGLFVVGQAPWALSRLTSLPVMRGKQAAVFCTFALNPGKTLEKMTRAVEGRGAEVIGGLALHRAKLDQHAEEFASRLVDAVPAR